MAHRKPAGDAKTYHGGLSKRLFELDLGVPHFTENANVNLALAWSHFGNLKHWA